MDQPAIPACLPPPTIRQWTVPDLPRRSASRFPDSPALHFTVRPSVTVNSMPSPLLCPGATQAWCRGTCGAHAAEHPQAVIAYYGAMKAGAVVVPMNPLYVEREIQTQLAGLG